MGEAELSGLELREAVAVKVMGYGVEHFNRTLVRSEPTGDCDFTVPAYESDIAAAWLVVERMRELGAMFLIRSYMSNSVFPWGACFKTILGREEYTAGDTAPEAICRAALAAVEAQ